ncbi:MAG: nucleotidyl transferase AbiEii/AbiGii toxin family protein [Acidimicrobiales bacterium]
MLPGDTAATWLTIAPLMPASAYLVGGTALTVHLQHRVSRDLDFFLEREEDLDALWGDFQSAGNVKLSERSEGTLNCLFNETKVQVLDASTQRLIRTTTRVAGIRVASVEDIMATKVKVIVDRGELRDYFDLMCIEERVGLQVETGISLAVQKYSPPEEETFVFTILKALGSFGDVADDPSLPSTRQEIEDYWTFRQLQVAKRLDAFGAS